MNLAGCCGLHGRIESLPLIQEMLNQKFPAAGSDTERNKRVTVKFAERMLFRGQRFVLGPADQNFRKCIEIFDMQRFGKIDRRSNHGKIDQPAHQRFRRFRGSVIVKVNDDAGIFCLEEL